MIDLGKSYIKKNKWYYIKAMTYTVVIEGQFHKELMSL